MCQQQCSTLCKIIFRILSENMTVYKKTKFAVSTKIMNYRP